MDHRQRSELRRERSVGEQLLRVDGRHRILLSDHFAARLFDGFVPLRLDRASGAGRERAWIENPRCLIVDTGIASAALDGLPDEGIGQRLPRRQDQLTFTGSAPVAEECCGDGSGGCIVRSTRPHLVGECPDVVLPYGLAGLRVESVQPPIRDSYVLKCRGSVGVDFESDVGIGGRDGVRHAGL